MTLRQSHQPLSHKLVMRISVTIIIILTLLVGYYESTLYIWQTNHRSALEKFNVNTTKELLKLEVETK